MLAIARSDERSIRAETPRSPGKSSEGAKKYQKGRNWAFKRDQNTTKKASKSTQMSQQLSKTAPLGKRVDFRCQKGSFGSHFGTPFWTHFRIKSIQKSIENSIQKNMCFWMPKLCQKGAKIDAQMHQKTDQKQTQKQRVKTCKNMTFRRAENALIYRKGHRI